MVKILSNPHTLLLERDDAFRALDELADRCALGAGFAVAITGEAGVGKTSLVSQFCERVQGRFHVLWGACEPLHTARSLGPLRDFAHTVSEDFTRQLAGPAALSELLETLVASVREREKPTLLVFEDVHWADEGTLDAVRFLSRRVARLPLCMLLTFRSDEVGIDHPLRRTLGDIPAAQLRRLTLQPLSRSAVATLSGRGVADAEALYRATGGNPFYVTEVIAEGEAGPMPPSVRDAVLARLGRLPPTAREAIDVASLIPGRSARRTYFELIGEAANQALAICVDRGLLMFDEREQTYAFRHELARLATESAVNVARKKSLHRDILAALRGMGEADPSRLLHHAVLSEDTLATLQYAQAAGAQAARHGAHKQAAQHYATALRAASVEPASVRAQLHESWSYEAGLSKIDDAVIAARHRAIELWREIGNAEKVALNFRWLSRLHWYRGERKLADQFIDESIYTLASKGDSEEKAWGMSVRSQMYMLNETYPEAIDWGERAVSLAARVNALEVRTHALNNIGCALLFGQLGDGLPYLEESLSLALEHRFHEQAARVYTNVASYGNTHRRLDLAERFATEGLEFDRKHDLDSWTYYLEGVLAQIYLQRGRMDEAAELARGALDAPDLTQVMRMPALNVLAAIAARRGDDNARALLEDALKFGLQTEETQRICPVVTVIAEYAWLRDKPEDAYEALAIPLYGDVDRKIDPWLYGDWFLWRHRLGMPNGSPSAKLPPPHQLEIEGRIADAAKEWAAIGEPLSEAVCLAFGDADQLRRAIVLVDPMGAALVSHRLRALAKTRGLRGVKRGPYAASRSNAFGLTAKEYDVLQLMARGLSNPEIAHELFRSIKTVEHHASAVLGKLGARSRVQAIEIARKHALFST